MLKFIIYCLFKRLSFGFHFLKLKISNFFKSAFLFLKGIYSSQFQTKRSRFKILSVIFEIYILCNTTCFTRTIELHIDKNPNVNNLIIEKGTESIAILLATWIKKAISVCAIRKLNGRYKRKEYFLTPNNEETVLNYILRYSLQEHFLERLPLNFEEIYSKDLTQELKNYPELIIQYQIIVKLNQGFFKSYFLHGFAFKNIYKMDVSNSIFEHLTEILLDLNEKYNLSSYKIEGFKIKIFLPQLKS